MYSSLLNLVIETNISQTNDFLSKNRTIIGFQTLKRFERGEIRGAIKVELEE